MTHKIQIDNLVRDATADETAQIEAREAEAQAEAEAAEAKTAKKIAVLNKLGLTEDEAAALLS